MKQLLVIAAFSALSLVSACGFRPVYATPSGGAIAVDTIPGRSGHALRKALLRDLAAGLPGVMEGATLNVRLNEQLAQLAFTSDGAAARSSLRARATYVLSYGGTAVSGATNTEATFNVPGAAYGDIAAQLAASDRAMENLSQNIVDNLRMNLASKE